MAFVSFIIDILIIVSGSEYQVIYALRLGITDE